MRSALGPGGPSHRPQRDYRALAVPCTLPSSGERVLNHKHPSAGRRRGCREALAILGESSGLLLGASSLIPRLHWGWYVLRRPQPG